MLTMARSRYAQFFDFVDSVVTLIGRLGKRASFGTNEQTAIGAVIEHLTYAVFVSLFDNPYGGRKLIYLIIIVLDVHGMLPLSKLMHEKAS